MDILADYWITERAGVDIPVTDSSMAEIAGFSMCGKPWVMSWKGGPIDEQLKK